MTTEESRQHECTDGHTFLATDEMFRIFPPPYRFRCDCARRQIEITIDRNHVWRFRFLDEEAS